MFSIRTITSVSKNLKMAIKILLATEEQRNNQANIVKCKQNNKNSTKLYFLE